jgi:hypothetical protein
MQSDETYASLYFYPQRNRDKLILVAALGTSAVAWVISHVAAGYALCGLCH